MARKPRLIPENRLEPLRAEVERLAVKTKRVNVYVESNRELLETEAEIERLLISGDKVPAPVA